jgi:hypothetical protein
VKRFSKGVFYRLSLGTLRTKVLLKRSCNELQMIIRRAHLIKLLIMHFRPVFTSGFGRPTCILLGPCFQMYQPMFIVFATAYEM